MKAKRILLALIFLVTSGIAFAQGGREVVTLDATVNGTSRTLPGDGLGIRSEPSPSNPSVYSSNVDYWFSVCGTCTHPLYMSFVFDVFDINPTDTIYIYDGADITAPLIVKANNSLNNLNFRTISVTPNNTSNCLTVRFKTDGSSDNNAGFSISAQCAKPCESAVPYINSMFYKTRNGEVYDSAYVKKVYEYDTVSHTIVNGDTVWILDTTYFMGANLCLGDGVIFTGRCDYTYLTGHYTPSDETTLFHWDFGNSMDSLVGVGETVALCEHYYDLDCYDVMLHVTDMNGCVAGNFASVRVRLAQNPLKTIYDLETICTVDSLPVNVSYDGEGNGSITLRRISFEKMRSKTNDVRTFLPDGPNCTSCGLTVCYSAPVEFREFPAGRKVTSKEDICSICVNFEHEFMGDYELSIVCPSGQKAQLKYKNAPAGYPSAAGGGGGTFTGYPYGGNSHHTYDGMGGGSCSQCDTALNPYGEGLDYCFSRNAGYTLVDGQNAATTTLSNSYLASNSYMMAVNNHTFAPIPTGYFNAGQSAGAQSFTTKQPSDHENKTDYYTPADDFSSLVGCPLNGTWEIEVCDTWGFDNGWVFSWSLDVCGISSGSGCEYQVALDSVIWLPDSTLGDWNTGRYRGLNINKHDLTTAYILSPDTAGDFRVLVTLYDEFGCVWDTNTNIRTIWTPEPNLGPDTLLCNVDKTYLDGRDRHSNEHFTYAWAPNGETTDTIFTATGTGQSAVYVVEATNTDPVSKHYCKARDSINVTIGKQPVPSFDPGVYPLEGCEPFTIDITNYSTFANKHRWVFGDGEESTEATPRHTYGVGVYDFRYYVVSEDGCVDSLIYDSLITVFPTPRAAFSWEPTYPTVMNPVINLENRTVPMIDANKYFWEIQYDIDAPYSVHTLTDVNPSFEWENDEGKDISGTYIVRLISRTDNVGPSGNVSQCSDTVENAVLLVNDFLQFPNVVTPNGDGVNDRFVIVNLVEGHGYPVNCLDVYNKWGARVFHKENISRTEDFWDPAKDNIPTGTYFYRFSGVGFNGNIERNGCVEILR